MHCTWGSILIIIFNLPSFHRELRANQQKQITLNLCIALLGLYCCFLIVISWTFLSTICIIFGALLHFFCLSSVAWMSVESTELYLHLVKGIDTHGRNFVMKAALFAWGLPLAVVVICAFVMQDDYSHHFCFPKSSSFVFYVALLGVVAILLTYDIVIYIVISWILFETPRNNSVRQTNRTTVVRRFQNAFAFSVLHCLSWCFSFLAVGSWKISFSILSCLCNFFLGVFIFFSFFLMEEEVRVAWRNRLHIKARQPKRECNPPLQQSNVISTLESGAIEKEITNEASCKIIKETSL
ncbi:Adhesion G-protein coupled receptor G4 [Holothuria leucospilota]|uniref:Adhesion G-protein coupled receptor G4 n=1 Tax=Holothuria leucospilota TaxID=206669 RepID=A0A9Q0YBW5_HOLLE|nr:Adhesion G-protein coupled receptor G4 [Holothuria leucospilota]